MFNEFLLEKIILNMEKEYLINNTKVVIGVLQWILFLNKNNF